MTSSLRSLLPLLSGLVLLAGCGQAPMASVKPQCDTGGAECGAGFVCEQGACLGDDGNACSPQAPCGAKTRCIEGFCRAPASPLLSSVEPWSGPVEGGTPVTLEGSGFVAAMRVRFGAREATEVTLLGTTRLTARPPPGAEGPVDVTVAAPGDAATARRPSRSAARPARCARRGR